MDEDADDIIEFAAALALFLERFEEWRSYRDAALTSPPSPESIEATLTETREITSDLLDDDAFDPAIAAGTHRSGRQSRRRQRRLHCRNRTDRFFKQLGRHCFDQSDASPQMDTSRSR